MQPPCVNKLDIIVAENIIIPQRIIKNVNAVVTNTGTCPVASLAAALTLPAGWSANSYQLANGLAVNESRGVTLIVTPADITPGTYSAVLKFDAPGISLTKNLTLSLIENPPYEVVFREVPISEKVFGYIILILIIEFAAGAVIIMLWEKPRQKIPQLSPELQQLIKRLSEKY